VNRVDSTLKVNGEKERGEKQDMKKKRWKIIRERWERLMI
jgi:hypothetical protein